MTSVWILCRIDGAIDRWLTAPAVAHAPQSLGIFRIIYALFYLWHLSFQRAELLSGLPRASRRLIVVAAWFPFDTPPIVFQAIESIVVACLVLLLFGWRTRVMTAAVLVAGALLESLFSVADKENGTVFLTFFIPFVMLLAGAPWGDAYALDALRLRRAASPGTAARYALPLRATLVILSALFCIAGLNKMIGSGIWLRDFTVMANFGLYHNVDGALLGLRLNPWAAWVKELPILHVPIQLSILLFETTFFLALFERRLLRLYIGLALVFQAVNGLLFVLTFTPLLIAYASFLDWESVRRGVMPRASLKVRSATMLTLLAWTIAVALAATWNLGTFTRSILSLGSVIDWRSIFWPILPLGLWLVSSAIWQIGRAISMRMCRSQITEPAAASR
ncbi:MAG: hypothetical protein H7Z14_10230 [Anaerolineae bacterium]|nr:hypothetical protein [Phycisphaerae bacterium]